MIKEGDRMILLLELDQDTLGRLKAYRDTMKEPQLHTISDVINLFIKEELDMWDHTCRMFDEYDDEDDRSEKDCMWEDDE